MDPMMSAMKARRGGQQQMQSNPGADMEMAEGGQPQGQQMGDLVTMLSPEQKAELMELLAQDIQSSEQGDVSAGDPSMEEKGEMREKFSGQDGPDEESAPSDQSDDIAMSMIDRNSLMKADAGAKPSGLGDRAKMYAAKKLQSKGKMK